MAEGQRLELIAALYGPGRVETELAGVAVTVTTRTAYPAEQAIEFDVQPARPARFTLTVRIPGWCHAAKLSLNRQPLDLALAAGTFVPVEREWQPGDQVRLELPFELGMQRFPKGGISIDYGPLSFSLPVAAHAEIETGDSTNDQRRAVDEKLYTPCARGATADFPAWELTPAGRWNYALCVDEQSLPRLAQIEWQEPSAITPFDPAQPFVTMRLPARMVEGWDLDQRPNGVSQENNWVVNGQWRHGSAAKSKAGLPLPRRCH